MADLGPEQPVIEAEWTYVRKDGSSFPVSLCISLLRGKCGEILGYLGIATDISERQQHEQNLRIAAIAFASQAAIMVTDAEQRILQVNQAFSTLTGYPAAEAIEAEIAELEPATAAQRFGDDSASLLARLRTDPDLDVEAIYPVARTASDLATFVAVEMHLIARMLDPTYEPDDARTLMRTLNESLRSMLGHGAEDWVSERVKPWRNMVIRRGLAWP